MLSKLIIFFNHPLAGVIVGATITAVFSLVIEYLRNKQNKLDALEQKKEEFYIEIIEYITDLYSMVLTVKDPAIWRGQKTSTALTEKFSKIIPKFILYGNDRIKEKFTSVSMNLLMGVPCIKEINLFYKLLSFELNSNLKKSSMIAHLLFKIKNLSLEKEVINENKKYSIQILFNTFNSINDNKNNKTVVIVYIKYVETFIEQNKILFDNEMYIKTKEALLNIKNKPIPKNITENLDKLAPILYLRLKSFLKK